ncbi:Calycin-like protein [Delitschia confertaspora ATCC 74209]|uniref:Calycin-like protein n=1 Tax=Delitschia confertaspora ATCC 74209 TaxID=1513339 RepID=A0A9P4JU72_9PLEO|nr:Calycin-like protein [Delitschia confertaspora ATCC 74209]
MRLSLFLSSITVASALSVSLSPHGHSSHNKSTVVPALYESSTKCVYPVPDPRFNLQKYLGKWYQVAGTPFRQTSGARCVAAQYRLNENGTVAVQNISIGPNNQTVSVNGTATPASKEYGQGGVLTVEFPQGYPSKCPGPNYIVQEYGDDHAIVQTANWGVLYILARERNPPQERVEKWISNAVRLGSNATAIMMYDQTNCE